MTDDIRLLPCPFCGGDAEMDTRQGYLALGTGRPGHRIAVYCRSCDADMGVCIEDVPDITPKQVAEMWNRRAAVEADRQRMGEPIGYFQDTGHYRYEQVGDDFKDDSDVFPLYRAPHPAEPVKMPSEAWALVEKYADAVSAYNEAVRIDVGVDKAGQKCLAIERDLRVLLSRYSKPALLSSNPGTLSSKPAASAEPVATLHDDGHYTFKRQPAPYGSDHAGWRMDVFAAPITAQPTVPLYPTDKWVHAFFGKPDETGFYYFRGDFGNVASRYQEAMLTAAPTPPAVEQPNDQDREDAGKYRRLHTPEITDFLGAVENEALYQRERWGETGDAGKADADWFWLVGYLAGKAIRPDATDEKRLHHIITTAAACLNWHAARVGTYIDMRPGIADPDAARKEQP